MLLLLSATILVQEKLRFFAVLQQVHIHLGFDFLKGPLQPLVCQLCGW